MDGLNSEQQNTVLQIPTIAANNVSVSSGSGELSDVRFDFSDEKVKADSIDLSLLGLANRQRKYSLYERYYRGNHLLQFATEKFENAFGGLFTAFSDNLMKPVVNGISDNLRVENFTVESGESAMSEKVWQIWQANYMEQRSMQVHREAVKTGDAYVFVWKNDNGEVILYPNKANVCTVCYDEEMPNVILWALKVWKSGKVWRLNLFLPDRVEKYTASRNDDTSSTIPKFASFNLIETMDNPFKFVPVFHFSLDADIGEFGQSEIDNLIPLNDALNKQVLDMLVASEFCAYPQRYAVGLETDSFPKDAKGNPISPFKLGVDGVWAVDSPDTKFGQFATANLDQYIHVQESIRAEIARVASIPLHYLMLQSATMASGRALQTAERRFLAKMLGIQISFGAKWAELMTFALKISNQNVKARLFTQWADISSVSETERLQTLQIKKSLGVPTSQLLIESGYGASDAAKLLAESIREKQLSDNSQQLSVSSLPNVDETN